MASGLLTHSIITVFDIFSIDFREKKKLLKNTLQNSTLNFDNVNDKTY